MSGPPKWIISAVSALLTLLVFQGAGWYLAWGVLKFEAQNDARRTMMRQDADLQTVTLSVQTFSNIRVGKQEIRLDKNLYDIQDQKFTGDSVRLFLYHDRQEESLFEALSDMFAPDDEFSRSHLPPLQYLLAKWLGSTFLAPRLTMTPTLLKIGVQSGFFFQMPLAQFDPGLLLPPPERLLRSLFNNH